MPLLNKAMAFDFAAQVVVNERIKLASQLVWYHTIVSFTRLVYNSEL